MGKRARWEWAVPIVVALWLPGAGCGLFDTRDPVIGDTEGGIWIPPTRAEIVVENLERAFEAGVFTDYQRALTEDFLFTPDESDVATYEQERPGEDVFGEWTAEVETNAAESIWTGAGGELELTLTFTTEQLIPEGRLRKYDYTLLVTTSGQAQEYRGEAWFSLTQLTGGDWAIFGWEDVASDSQVPSWGFLKGAQRLF
ncbi:MAG: hypothetical protein DHS20C21_10820 [Gemmatimonadota bacterium]|nr:MAG: hypothetical protein DHS20C21_10820 [Gemmatimonadota bacterium]